MEINLIGKITSSNVVLIAIDRVASQCAKLKARYIKKGSDEVESEKSGNLSYILRNKPKRGFREMIIKECFS